MLHGTFSILESKRSEQCVSVDRIDVNQYSDLIDEAVRVFWRTRDEQLNAENKKSDQGNRGAVTGGKHLDGFARLFRHVAFDIGVPESCIISKGSTVPGFFRPTKSWDQLIVTPRKQLISAIEFKSQKGSFGNNLNNRAEEALGNAVDLWTAFREKSFPQIKPPWIGYLVLVERSATSKRVVRVSEPHFRVREEFRETSYLDRYVLLCQKLMLEKHYSHAALIWTEENGEFGYLDDEISIQSQLRSFIGHLHAHLDQFS